MMSSSTVEGHLWDAVDGLYGCTERYRRAHGRCGYTLHYSDAGDPTHFHADGSANGIVRGHAWAIADVFVSKTRTMSVGWLVDSHPSGSVPHCDPGSPSSPPLPRDRLHSFLHHPAQPARAAIPRYKTSRRMRAHVRATGAGDAEIGADCVGGRD